MRIRNIFMMCTIILILIPIVSSAVPNLGTFKTNDEIELKQTCVINGSFCDACNISSVDYPNGSRAIYDIQMTKRTADFNYTLNSTYTSTIGEYKVNGYCTYGSDVMKNFVYYFEVNYTGEDLSQQQTSLYIVALVVLVMLILGTVFVISRLPGKDSVDQAGMIVQINNLKYLRNVLWIVIWGICLAIIFLTSNLLIAYIPNNMAGTFFFTLYQIMFYITMIGVPVYFIYLFVQIYQNKEMQKMINRGVEIRGTP